MKKKLFLIIVFLLFLNKSFINAESLVSVNSSMNSTTTPNTSPKTGTLNFGIGITGEANGNYYFFADLEKKFNDNWSGHIGDQIYSNITIYKNIFYLKLKNQLYYDKSTNIKSTLYLGNITFASNLNATILVGNVVYNKDWDRFSFFTGINVPLFSILSDDRSKITGDILSILGYLGIQYKISDFLKIYCCYYKNEGYLGINLIEIPILLNLNRNNNQQILIGSPWIIF